MSFLCQGHIQNQSTQKDSLMKKGLQRTILDFYYIYDLSTLVNSTLIILISEMLKFSKNIYSKSKNIVKDNSEYFGIFHFLQYKFQNN